MALAIFLFALGAGVALYEAGLGLLFLFDLLYARSKRPAPPAASPARVRHEGYRIGAEADHLVIEHTGGDGNCPICRTLPVRGGK